MSRSSMVGFLLLVLAASRAGAAAVPPTLRLPEGARPVRYELDLTVDPTRDTFRGEVRIHLELSRSTSLLWLNATGLTVTGATAMVAGGMVPARTVPGGEDFLGFALDRVVGPGPVVLDVSYNGPIDATRSRGLYRVREPDGQWYAYTFFEAIDARRAVPCFDEPDAKVPWKLRLRVRRGDVALANTPVVSELDEDDGLKLVTFAESKPLPSYLLAFVVGPFEVVGAGTAGRYGTPLRFVVPRGRIEELRYAREVTPTVVGLLEDYFGMPYPYEKLDVAVVPRYWGTMEHPGLLAMGQPLTLIPPAEESFGRRESYANILTHELAHYWFGDYVTCAWWDDVWLNESLGTWLDGKLTERLEPAWRHATLARRNTAVAMEKDALGTAKSIRQPVEARSDIESAFDAGITYFKGAAVLRMFESWLGQEVFRSAIRRYLAAHAWGNATAADFLAALDREAGRRVSPAFRSFVERPGLPLVSATLDCRAAPRLRLRQTRFLSLAASPGADEPWQMPVCARWGAEGRTGRVCTLMESHEQELTLPTVSCPDWVVANEGAAGYYRVAYDDDLGRRVSREAAKGGGSALVAEERIAFLDDLVAMVGAGRVRVATALEALPAALSDSDPLVVVKGLDLLALIPADRLDDSLRPNYARAVRQLLGPRATALGWEPGRDPRDLRVLRERLVPHAAVYGEDQNLRAEARRRVLAWLEKRGSVDADLSWWVLIVGCHDGDRALFDRVLGEARRSRDRVEQVKLFAALGAFLDPALAKDALALLLGDEFDLRESVRILWGELSQRETRDLAYSFLWENFDGLRAKMRSDEASWLVGGVASASCDAERRREAAAFFESRVGTIDGGPLALANGLEAADVCIAERARNAAGVAEFLSRY